MKLLKNHLGALIAWIAILLIAVFSLPNVDALTRQHSEISLPKDVQSSIATNIESKWGHGQDNTYVLTPGVLTAFVKVLLTLETVE